MHMGVLECYARDDLLRELSSAKAVWLLSLLTYDRDTLFRVDIRASDGEKAQGSVDLLSVSI
jgi:hypothetical protein